MVQLKTEDFYKPVMDCCCRLAHQGSGVSSGCSSLKVEMITSLTGNVGSLFFNV